jgi:lambda family phage portal protein
MAGAIATFVRRTLATFNQQDGEARVIPYEAAGQSGPRNGRWRVPAGGPNTVMGGSLSTLRARSRDGRRNDGLADTIIEVLVDNLIGTGIKPQFQTKNAKLNAQLAQLFLDWTDEADADEMDDFYGQQAMAFGSMLEGGDCFGRLRVRRLDDGYSVPLQIQLLEGEFVPEWWTRPAPGGSIQQGIEFDFLNQRRAYWMFRVHPGDWMAQQFVQFSSMIPYRVDAADVMHLAHRKRPGAIRGEPWLVRALIKLHDLDEYDDAQLVRQKISAMFAGFVKNVNANPFAVEPDDLQTEDGGQTVYPSLDAGTLQNLDENEEIEFSTPPSPGDSFEAYMAHQERRVAKSGGIMYESLTGDFSKVNDRTYRAAVNEFRRRIQRLQGRFIFQWCRPAMNRWVDLAIMAGAITLPRGVTAADVKRVNWTPQAFPYLNPVQDIQAKREEVRSGFKSRRRTVSEAGDDVEQTDAEIASDNERADKAGLVFDSDARYTDGSGAGQQSPQDEPPAPTPGNSGG